MDAGSLVIARPGRPSSPWIGAAWMLALVLLLSVACIAVLGSAAALTRGGWEAVWNYRRVFLQGWFLTVLLSVASLLLSLLLGLVAALLRGSRVIPFRMAAVLYVELIRGTPLLAQILFLYYAVAASIGLQDRLTAGVLILSLFSGAYLSEILRAGIASVPATQLDSARAVGFTRWQTYRFVIFPQALRTVLPPLAGQFASLIKDSSLLSIIGIGEFTLAAQQVNSATYRTLESYLPLAAGYLLLTLPISLLSRHLERRLRHED